MKIEIRDKSLMMVFLLKQCNLKCAHCSNEDAPMDVGYKLSFRQLQLCLSDCRELESVSWVHFTGGEPTLWKEKNRNLIDLLLEISNAGFIPGFTTNGSLFVDYSRCRSFFAKYIARSTMPLRVYFSIDTFHRNFNLEKGRARSLDNVMKCKQEFSPVEADRLNISVIVTISRDFDSLLPEEMIKYYESQGITFGFVPLFPKGRAKAISHLCPDLGSDDPSDLGAYQSFYKEKNKRERGPAKDRISADFINLIGDNYYFTNPWRKVAELGKISDNIISAYSDPTWDCGN